MREKRPPHKTYICTFSCGCRLYGNVNQGAYTINKTECVDTKEIEQLRAEVEQLRAFKYGVDCALNSGDGSYRP